ncbi:hypothetical protein [Oscillatoria nigro-viridis]|uniref:hypothetical protein n=1 Tax=Phormidium nigroviride TaxID=482564 RepID=UPI0002EFF09E|nr:hypothetical protein [Oscillatoria nigro-viridis]
MLNHLSAAFGIGGIQTQEYPKKRSLVFYTCGDSRAVRQGINSLPHSESPLKEDWKVNLRVMKQR